MAGFALSFLKRFPQSKNRGLILALGLMILLFGFAQHSANANSQQPRNESESKQAEAQKAIEPVELELGKPIEREMKGGESHSYTIRMEANQYLQAVVEQKGIDVAVTVYGPDGKKVYEIDSPNGPEGPEPINLIASSGGNHRLEIKPKDNYAKAAKYQVKVIELRASDENDRVIVAATKAICEAAQLQIDNNDQSVDKAIAKYEEAIALFQSVNDLLGEANAADYLAPLYEIKGTYSKAEQLYLQDLAIKERALGFDHIDVAKVLNVLAIHIEDYDGDYNKAEQFYNRSLEILEKQLGKTDPKVAEVIHNLGELFYVKGEYEKAKPLLEKAISIIEKTIGQENTEYADMSENLGRLYIATGEYSQAESITKHVLAIREKALGSTNQYVSTSLNNLATIFISQHEYEKAEPLLQRALAIDEKSLPPDHPYVAMHLNHMAIIYANKGEYSRAEPLLNKALEIWKKGLGSDHPNVAYALINLAVNFIFKNEYDKAATLLQQALAIREKSLGPNHPEVAACLDYLALAYWAKGELVEAIKYKEKANESREQELAHNLIAGSEKEKLIYINKTAAELDQTLSLHLQSTPNNLQSARMALNAILRRKGRALDAMADNIAILRGRTDPADQSLLADLNIARTQYSELVLKDGEIDGVENHVSKIKELEQKIESLESQISSRSSEFRRQLQAINLAAVQQLIPNDSVLIEFACYRPYNAKDRKYFSSHYAVYLLTSSGDPLFADLGEAEKINQVITELRRVLPDKRTSIDKEVKPLARNLDEIVMRPARKLIGDKKRLIIAPDGALNLIPFDVLVDEHGKFLVENYQISYLTSGRDLLRLQNGIASKQPPMIFANPDFGGEKEGSEQRQLKYNANKKRESDQSNKKDEQTSTIDYSRLYFSPLPGTAEEAKTLLKILPQAHLLIQAAASKANLAKIDSPEILHIATHGFFLTGEASSAIEAEASSRNLGLKGDFELDLQDRFITLKKINPLLRSGLGLAGANLKSENNDGILTALEAAGLNLWGTKLVVLSACDTGVGEVKNGDGVYGLRRALVLAGSETQMMSLWPVSDIGTRELMTSFYRNLKAGMGRSAALRDVQLKMIADPKRAHPFYWASFILSGEWANLDGKR